jgi:hypothetical protein
VRDLPEEEDAAEDSDAAREEFAGKIAAVLHTIQAFGTHVKAGYDTKVERRSLINFCEMWAKKQWGQIRSLNLWCRRIGPVLEVAFRRELFAQVGRSDLEKLSATKLTQLCERYDIGRGSIVLGRRAVVLENDFLLEHVAGPRPDADTGDSVGAPDIDANGTTRNGTAGSSATAQPVTPGDQAAILAATAQATAAAGDAVPPGLKRFAEEQLAPKEGGQRPATAAARGCLDPGPERGSQ